MSFEHTFLDEFDNEVENYFDGDEVQAFPETIISDSHQSSDCTDFLMSHDSLSLGQLDQGRQYFECQENLPSMSNECRDSGQTPSTGEDLPSSVTFTSFEDLCISYNQTEEKQSFPIRATLEKVINGNELPESSSSSSSNLIELDRDPSELDRQLKNPDENFFELKLISMPIVFRQVPLELEHKMFENGPKEGVHPFLNDSFEIPPLRQKIISPEKKKVAKKNKKLSGKKPHSRQSQYKNVYSLVEEHSRRLLKDWTELNCEEMERVEHEDMKSNAAQLEEEREIRANFKQFESDVSKNLKSVPSRQRNSEKLDIQAKRQKELIQKLKYKRFRLLSSLSRLVNDNPDAFITRTEFEDCLQKKPKTRTLACMKEFLKENIKFGLIVSRVAVELLPISMEPQQSNLSRKSVLAFLYWKVKSPMQKKNRELLRREDSRAHIRGVLKDVYLELKEAAQSVLPPRDLKMVEDCFSDYGELNNVSERQFGIDFELLRNFNCYINEHNQQVNGFLRDEDRLVKQAKRYKS